MPPTDDTQLILTLMMTAAEVVVNVGRYNNISVRTIVGSDHLTVIVPIIKELINLS